MLHGKLKGPLPTFLNSKIRREILHQFQFCISLICIRENNLSDLKKYKEKQKINDFK